MCTGLEVADAGHAGCFHSQFRPPPWRLTANAHRASSWLTKSMRERGGLRHRIPGQSRVQPQADPYRTHDSPIACIPGGGVTLLCSMYCAKRAPPILVPGFKNFRTVNVRITYPDPELQGEGGPARGVHIQVLQQSTAGIGPRGTEGPPHRGLCGSAHDPQPEQHDRCRAGRFPDGGRHQSLNPYGGQGSCSTNHSHMPTLLARDR